MPSYSPGNIVALATPPGLGALAIIRFSGSNLYETYCLFARKNPVDRKAVLSKIYHPRSNKLLDKAIITYFKSPNSFTGEDVIEISCHGGDAVPRSIIMAAIDSGARNADPGEFSYRAFLNGKLDLLQAEAISSLISSKSQLSVDVGLQHLLGRVSSILSDIRSDALSVLSVVENELNFSEDELELTSYKNIRGLIVNIEQKITTILNDSAFGRGALSGIRVIMLGKPNSGKSSLFNAILGFDRAIVSSIPGTTRDTVESYFELEGSPVCLVDTAGVWESKESLDVLGVQKTMGELDNASICVLIDEEDPSMLLKSNFSHLLKDNYILVKSKCDLDDSITSNDENILYVSAQEGIGIGKLLTYLSTYIIETVNTPAVLDHVLITRRQRHLLESAHSSLGVLIKQIDSGVETDVLASGLYGFITILKDVVGEIPDVDVLNQIFSNFCVGK